MYSMQNRMRIIMVFVDWHEDTYLRYVLPLSGVILKFLQKYKTFITS
jgi:hypothetical protein